MRFPAGLASCSLSLLLLAPPAPAAAVDFASSVPARLELPAGTPDAFTVRLERNGAPVTLDLVRRSLRAPGFRLRAWTDGETVELASPPVVTYQGVVRGEPGTIAAGALGGAGLSLRVFPVAGRSWSIRPLVTDMPGAAPGDHRVIEGGGDWPEGLTCGVTATAGGDPTARSAGEDRTAAAAPLWCGPGDLERTEIAFDVDQVYYRDHGSDLAATLASVEGLLAEVDAFYARDARITYAITDVIIRTTDFYLPDPTASLLDLFRAEWNANQTGVVRDIAHLMTGQPAPGLAGLAYVGVVCNLPWCYGWSVDSAGVLGHEIGHNWNAGHCHDQTPCNNMCGACLYIAPNTQDIIAAFRDTRACLDPVPPYPLQVPPYAHPDHLAVSRDDSIARPALPVDVLGNDHDANCDDLAIAGFDAESERGGDVALDPGGGPGGRDRLLYTPPCMPFAGSDSFSYTVTDNAGGDATTVVSAAIADPGLAGLWTLDDGGGAIAADATGWARDGQVNGTPLWTAGRHGGALALDGIDQHVTLPALDLPGLPVTITAWVKRNGPLAAFAAIAFCRGAGTTAGLHVGNANDLRYTWSDDPATWGASTGLILPDGTWAFVALVVEPGRVTLWLDDGTSWRRFENLLDHAAQRFAADVQLGWDPTSAGRHLAATIDDVRFYDAALSEAELQAVRDGGVKAEAPHPADGSTVSDPGIALTWRPAAGAGERDLYFGRDFAGVRAATPASPEYRGRIAALRFDPPGLLADGYTFAWRVDEVILGTPVAGDTWLFTLRGSAPRLLHYWPLDEGTGTATTDRVGGAAAELRNGTLWDVGPYLGAVSLDGVDDIVAAPLPGTTLAETTVTAWVRSRGTPAPRAGLVFTRGGAATGLGLDDTATELSYHWDDGQWWWSSGLTVPIDEWVFVALAVRADAATLHIADSSGWRSATNAVTHRPVPWTGELFLGRDSWGAARSFAGLLDDVRIYDKALTAAEVAEVHDQASRADNPVPADGATLLSAPSQLVWVGGAGALSHDLYAGDDLDRVRAATPLAPEFRGNLALPTWNPPPDLFAAGETGYWRVDTRTATGVTAGRVWRFLRSGEMGPYLRAVRTPAGVPQLAWPGVEGSESYEIQRCTPSLPGGCAPVAVATAGAAARTWDDAAASASILWYRVAAHPCLP